jgi:hypothetical protein
MPPAPKNEPRPFPEGLARGTGGLVSMIEKVARIAQRKTRPASSVGQDARPGDRVQADMGRRCMVVDADPRAR